MHGELTERQVQVLRVLCRWIHENGYPPSVRELGEALGLTSTRTVHDHLGALEAKGYIRRHKDRSRALEVLADVGSWEDDSEDASTAGKVTPLRRNTGGGVAVPLVGDVAAGQPILAREEHDESLVVDPSLVRDPRTYALRVRGDSMVEAHICDGDMILVRPQNEAQNGETVVALIGDDVTLKRFFRREGYVELKPENSTMASIILTPDMGDVRILGKLMGVVRRC